ncbi:group II intron reverse transcriptase domain-containing protein [Candidatus Uhrbacteria bacterium]|nr:group II intron reverse transcriptase domain-containing protein [Candidatus Uhrbacteria bacterium]
MLGNLLEAWGEFVRGKRARSDVMEFELNLMENLIELHFRLANFRYCHEPYQAFTILDPKTRKIHKATVIDRILHRAVYRKLYPTFDPTFITDSFSCRKGKGTHKALDRFRAVAWIASHNHRRTIWVLKCDIRKFFASVDHATLIHILDQQLDDKLIVNLLSTIVESFHVEPGKGLPLGNITSQLFANIYMNEFDQFVKHGLGFKHYIRYADDFVFLSQDRRELQDVLSVVTMFLQQNLHLSLHPNKVKLRTFASGVDFLGWVHFPDHRVLRSTTKRRMWARLSQIPSQPVIQSYLGLLSHGNSRKLISEIENRVR